MTIEIRPLQDMADIRAAEQIQIVAWNMDPLEAMPAHVMHATAENGACLLGAFDGERLVGFAYAILGMIPAEGRIDPVAAARLQMYSVITGVLPEYQKQGVGYLLKVGQRDFAMRVGVRLITWTYDPLESVNGRFNIAKLGAVCQRFHRNFHGDMGGINAGLPTDRFHVDWWVTSNRVQSRTTKQRRPLQLAQVLESGAFLVNEAAFNPQGHPVPPPNYVSQPSNIMLTEIPSNFQAIKQEDPALAKRWREHTRAVFEALFDSGFMVTDFIYTQDEQGHQRSFYLLTFKDA